MPAVAARPFTFDERTRRYRAPSGRFIPWQEVRKGLDAVIDGANEDICRASESLQAGRIEIGDWQARMAASIKAAHVAAAMAATGGRKQLTASDLGYLGSRLRFQYEHLRGFAQDLANDLPLDGRFLTRAAMYGTAATGTYEAVLRRDDIASGKYDEERRQRHSKESCFPCIEYEQRGWQLLGALPGIGEQSPCLSACRCTFLRRRSSQRAIPTARPAVARVAQPEILAAAREFGPSSARVRVDPEADFTIDDALTHARRLFGREMTTADMASVVGAPDKSLVTIRKLQEDRILVAFRGNGFEAERNFGVFEGKQFVENEIIVIDEDHQGKGLGASIFGRQVETATRLGFREIFAEAARAKDMNGYYTWPRFGFDGELPYSVRGKVEAGVIPPPPGGADRVSDLMLTDRGRDWWEEHGQSIEVTFDLAEGSLSRRVWDDYRAEKARERAGKVGLAAFAVPLRLIRRFEWPDFTEEDMAIVDRVWARLAVASFSATVTTPAVEMV